MTSHNQGTPDPAASKPARPSSVSDVGPLDTAQTQNAAIYLDNAATSFPKPSAVHEAMFDFATRIGASPGRGAYAASRQAGQLVTQCRQRIAALINAPSPEHIVFTLNASDALNLAIKGLMLPGEPNHIILTDMEHNSVLRPVSKLVADGIATATYIPADPATGAIDSQAVASAITPHTRLIALIHASNVSGTLMPIDEVGTIARNAAIPFLVDAAQTAGHYPINVVESNIDLLAAPGHKGLLGPLGTGLLYIRPGLEKHLHTLRQGGTGSNSDSDIQPQLMPDKYEPGSHNTIGIVGLSQGVQWILDRGVQALWQHEQTLTAHFLTRFRQQQSPNLHLIGPSEPAQRMAVFSVYIDGLEPNELAAILEDQFQLCTRAGIHCAPRAHKTFNTEAIGGTVRLSFGAFNTIEHVDAACRALHEISAATASLSTTSI